MGRAKKSKRFIFYLIIIILFLAYKIINVRDYLPLNLDYATIKIETPDANNPTKKLLTYKTQAINKSKETVKLKYHFTKDKDAENWYPYYNIIPDEYVSETVILNPDEIKEYITQLTVKSNDERLITSLLSEVKVQYEIIQ
ncbi:hypothetical protein J2Z76_002389 [Sedimentibacter acidaminivorans]|uniref:Uncharacterized protein n=1 Tax=Sedimentibacter acidaminivorans TaxID=913099 RepID=A0ABS4GGL5_9FIRM|nr:hypothetical protein [Sedimentibacter acidaminivorans]MBP1926520.1 hypothetical protein [Sedimentibacter acidaminivorans]